MTGYDLRLSGEEHEQIDKAELALKSSIRAREQMRELYFSSSWAQVDMVSDDLGWAMDMNRLKDDLEKYVTLCIDVVATAARSFGALEPFRECVGDKAEDIKKRALMLIDHRDRPLLDSHISRVASDRLLKWQKWADKELKPAWMERSEVSPGNTEQNSGVAIRVEAAKLSREMGAQDLSRPPQVSPPSQVEIETYANEIFRAGLEDRNERYGTKQNQALHEASLKKNVGAYLPTLIRCKRERLRTEVLILADAWVTAGTTYGVSLGAWAEKALEKAATLMVGGIASALQGEIDLHSVRTSIPSNSRGAREINLGLNSALGEAKLRLKTQRIKAARLPERAIKEPGTAQAALAKLMDSADIEGDGQKRRGRPTVIPDERKQAAVECKANGGTNRDAAMLIYDRRYPTPQQVKNVLAILRNHQQGSKRNNSTGSARLKTSSKSLQK